MTAKFSKFSTFKADQRLGLLFGWAIICKRRNAAGVWEDYVDVQDDHIPEEAMVAAATEFMSGERNLKIMHKGKSIGRVIFALPVTDETTDAFNIACDKRGLIIAVKPDDPSLLKLFDDGTFGGFSIGGRRIRDEPMEM